MDNTKKTQMREEAELLSGRANKKLPRRHIMERCEIKTKERATSGDFVCGHISNKTGNYK